MNSFPLQKIVIYYILYQTITHFKSNVEASGSPKQESGGEGLAAAETHRLMLNCGRICDKIL